MENRVNISRSVFRAFCATFIVMLIFCWWLTIQLSRSRAYDEGRRDEYTQNPARTYIEDGRPFVWHNGTYYKARRVGGKTFVAE